VRSPLVTSKTTSYSKSFRKMMSHACDQPLEEILWDCLPFWLEVSVPILGDCWRGHNCHAVIFPTRPKHALLVPRQVNMPGNPSVWLLAAVRTAMPPLLHAAAHGHPVERSLGQWFQIQELPKDEEFHLCIEQQSDFSSQPKEDRDPESYGERKSLRPLRYHPHICDVVERWRQQTAHLYSPDRR